MRSQKLSILSISLILLLHLTTGYAQIDDSDIQPNIRLVLHQRTYDIHADKTYTETVTEQYQVLTNRGIDSFKQVHIDFNPNTQKILHVSAYVTQPSGTRIKIPEDNIQTMPLSANLREETLSNKRVVLLTIPGLTIGSKLTTVTKKEIKPDIYGFNVVDAPEFFIPNAKRIIKLTFPKSLPMNVTQRGNYTITRTQSTTDLETITATLSNQPAHHPQVSMVDELDVSPLFSVSTLHSWQQIGDTFWQTAKNKVVVDNEIKNLAKSIVGNQRGLAAARAIYNWVVKNIYFVSVQLNDSAGVVPKASTETLKNRYGDCKAIVILLQALYEAVGIKSQPVLIGWNESYKPFPKATPYQFNHLILYLPDYKLFANSTDPYSPFGILDTDLQNKLAVIVGPKSMVVKTPLDDPKKNSYRVENKVILQPDGSLIGTTHFAAGHTLDAIYRSAFAKQFNSKEMANNILKNTVYGGHGNLHISDPEDLDLPIMMDANWESPQAINNTDEHLFLLLPEGVQPTGINSLRNKVLEGRIDYPITALPCVYYWHNIITVPLNYHIQSLPHDTKINNSAGNYRSQYRSISPSQIEIVYQLTIKKYLYTPDEYKKLKFLLKQSMRDARSILYFKQDKNVSSTT